MQRNVFAFTEPGVVPGYLSLNQRDDDANNELYVLTVRSPGGGFTAELPMTREALGDLCNALQTELKTLETAAQIT